MTYDSEYKCKACGAVGLNERDPFDHWVYCECGECLFEDETEDDD